MALRSRNSARQPRSTRSLAFYLSLTTVACGPAERVANEHALSQRAAIADGTENASLTAVFSLQTRYASTSRRCTALLVAQNLFLTARHCLIADDTVPSCDDAFPSLVDPSALDFTNPTRVDSVEAETTPVHHGALIHVPDGNSLCGDDLALVLTDDVVDVTPATLGVDAAPEKGEAYTAVGYGFLGELIGGEGTRRSRSDLSFVCNTAGCAPTLVDGEALGEAAPCEGDSGGPALDEQGRAVAILSRGTASCETPIYETLFAHREWLRAVAKEAAYAGDYELPDWVNTPDDVGLGGASAAQGGAGGVGGNDTVPHASAGESSTNAESTEDTGCSCFWVGGSNATAGRPIVLGALLGIFTPLRRLRRKLPRLTHP